MHPTDSNRNDAVRPGNGDSMILNMLSARANAVRKTVIASTPTHTTHPRGPRVLRPVAR